MPTKQNPGAFDCYKAALPDEPIFTILGRDLAGPATLEAWAAERIRKGKNTSADDRERIKAAVDEAAEMQEWRQRMVDASVDGVPPWRLPMSFVTDDTKPVCSLQPNEVQDARIVAEGIRQDVQRLRNWLNLRGFATGHPTYPVEILDSLSSRAAMLETATLADRVERLQEANIEYMGTAQIIAEIDEANTVHPEPDTSRDPGEKPLLSVDYGEGSRDAEILDRLKIFVEQQHKDERLPAPHEYYRAVHRGHVGTASAWVYEPLGFGLSDLKILASSMATLLDRTRDRSQPSAIRPPLVDEAPDDLAHSPEVPPHRFSQFHKGEHYAYARGLEINPIHLPTCMDDMLKDGWRLIAIFGQTDSKHVGFMFERMPPMVTINASGETVAFPDNETITRMMNGESLFDRGRAFEA